MKTVTSEMVPRKSGRPEVKWCLTSPEPSEIAEITSEIAQTTSEMVPTWWRWAVKASEMVPTRPSPVFTTLHVHCSVIGRLPPRDNMHLRYVTHLEGSRNRVGRVPLPGSSSTVLVFSTRPPQPSNPSVH